MRGCTQCSHAGAGELNLCDAMLARPLSLRLFLTKGQGVIRPLPSIGYQRSVAVIVSDLLFDLR